MSDADIKQIVTIFRLAIDRAFEKHLLDDDKDFCHFPYQCCGATSYILARYLLDNYSIRTFWVSTEYGEETHAWLYLYDDRVIEPMVKEDMPDEIKAQLYIYNGGKVIEQMPVYREENFINALLIDITADQFDGITESVYVDNIDSFHKQFVFISATETYDLNTQLEKVYRIIESEIEI